MRASRACVCGAFMHTASVDEGRADGQACTDPRLRTPLFQNVVASPGKECTTACTIMLSHLG